jgi:hypothetical protein
MLVGEPYALAAGPPLPTITNSYRTPQPGDKFDFTASGNTPLFPGGGQRSNPVASKSGVPARWYGYG